MYFIGNLNKLHNMKNTKEIVGEYRMTDWAKIMMKNRVMYITETFAVSFVNFLAS